MLCARQWKARLSGSVFFVFLLLCLILEKVPPVIFPDFVEANFVGKDGHMR